MTKSSFQARESYLVEQKLHLTSFFLQQNKKFFLFSPFLLTSTRQVDKHFWLAKMKVLSKGTEKQTFMFFKIVTHDHEMHGKVMCSTSVRVCAWALHTATLYAIFAPLRPNHFSIFDLLFVYFSLIHHFFFGVMSSFLAKFSMSPWILLWKYSFFFFLCHLLFTMFNLLEPKYSASHCQFV